MVHCTGVPCWFPTAQISMVRFGPAARWRVAFGALPGCPPACFRCSVRHRLQWRQAARREVAASKGPAFACGRSFEYAGQRRGAFASEFGSHAPWLLNTLRATPNKTKKKGGGGEAGAGAGAGGEATAAAVSILIRNSVDFQFCKSTQATQRAVREEGDPKGVTRGGGI